MRLIRKHIVDQIVQTLMIEFEEITEEITASNEEVATAAMALVAQIVTGLVETGADKSFIARKVETFVQETYMEAQ